MADCYNCGSPLPQNTDFCSSCGIRAYLVLPPISSPALRARLRPTSSRKAVLKWGAIGFGGLVALFLILVFVASKVSPTPQATSESQIASGTNQSLSNADTPTPEPVATPTVAPTPTLSSAPTSIPAPTPTLAPTPTPDFISFYGVGEQESSQFNLEQGLVNFRLTHKGNSYFAVRLLDERGESVALLAAVIGTFDGSQAVQIENAGTYILDISAGGKWTVSIDPAR